MKRFKDLPQKLRRGIIIALSIVLLAGLSYGILLIIRSNSSAVNVYSVNDAKVDYHGLGQSETSGKVFADRIQSVYVSSTQIVTEINVKEGDTVKKGDILMSFDTTLSDIELQRQEIKIGQLQLEIEQAERQLRIINTYKVGSPNYSGGGSNLTPYEHYNEVGDAVYEDTQEIIYVPERAGCGTSDYPYIFVWESNSTDPNHPSEVNLSALHSKGIKVMIEDEESSEEYPIYKKVKVDSDIIYAIFENRSGNSLDGNVNNSYMIEFTWIPGTDSLFEMRLSYDMPESYDPENPKDSSVVDTTVYISSAAELADMKREAQQKIDDLKLELKKAQYKYDVLEYELTTGTVYSNIDGKVITVADPEDVAGTKEPVLVVSGGGGYFVSGVLSETELSSMHVGDTVNAMSWESYQNYTATITEISEYPVDNSDNSYNHYSEGNSNASLYAFTAAIEEGAKVREGEYLNITYSPRREGSSGLYLSSMFIRTENGVHYVLAESPSGTLERREIRTGGTLWGSYTEVLSGLDTDDYIAFPYGRHIREGAKTKECPIEMLYNY